MKRKRLRSDMMPYDYNWMTENLETRTVEGRTWVRMDEKVYDALRRHMKEDE